jgi:hypothetical protein
LGRDNVVCQTTNVLRFAPLINNPAMRTRFLAA